MSAESKTIGRLMRVSGQVQGVFFRKWTVDAARKLGLTGWVRNRSDGTVEICAFGPPDAVQELARLAHSGPKSARVHDVAVEATAADAPSDFDVRRTV